MNKEFEEGHTHINNFHTAKFIVDLAIHKSVPRKKISPYLLESLIRISDDNGYNFRIERLLNNCKNRGGL